MYYCSVFTKVLATWLVVASAAQADDQKLNVLMIIVDDLAPVVSAYGGPVATPAIDRLAERGVRFTNNFANVPVCGASRASMLSGLNPTATRFLSYDSRLDRDAPDAVSLPAYLHQRGWHTSANGKVFDVIADSAAGFSEPVWSPDADWYGKAPDGRGEHLQAAFIEPVEGGRLPYFERLDVADTDYPDGQVAEKTVSDLQRLAQGDSPFFLAVGFRKPHLPFNAPQRYWQQAQQTQQPQKLLPATWFQPASSVPDAARHRSPELRGQYDALPLFGDPDQSTATEIVSAYHAAVRFVDAQIGQVLEGLAASGAMDNTLVILLGDHGFFLGEQRMWTKHALFETALRTPLIISSPGLGGGTEVTAVSDLLDVFPTVVDLLGLEMPAQLVGASLRVLLEDPQNARPNKPASVARWMNGESVRLGDHRYSRWFDEQGNTLSEMLFDLGADPLEQTNLADEADAAATIARLSQALEESRGEEIWSDQLAKQVQRWQLATSASGNVILAVMAYPLRAAALTLLVCVLLLLVFVRYRRRRRAAL